MNVIGFVLAISILPLFGLFLYKAFNSKPPKVIEGIYHKNKYSFRYVTGLYKFYSNAPEVVRLEIELPIELPHIFLDSFKNESVQGFLLTPRAKPILLEGDFHKHFDLYCAKGAEVLALSIITPDIMQDMMSQSRLVDIEIFRNRLNLYCPKKTFNNNEAMNDLIAFGEAIVNQLAHRIKSWQSLVTSKEEFSFKTTQRVGLFGSHRTTSNFIGLITLMIIIGTALVVSKNAKTVNQQEVAAAIVMYAGLIVVGATVWSFAVAQKKSDGPINRLSMLRGENQKSLYDKRVC